MFWTRGLFVALCAAICLAAPSAGVAGAGEYHVYSCRMPNGEAAPTDGWSGSATGAFVSAEDKCAQHGALTAALDDDVEHERTDIATWTLLLLRKRHWRKRPSGALATLMVVLPKAALMSSGLRGRTKTKYSTNAFTRGSEPCDTGKGESEDPLASANRLDVPQARPRVSSVRQRSLLRHARRMQKGRTRPQRLRRRRVPLRGRPCPRPGLPTDGLQRRRRTGHGLHTCRHGRPGVPCERRGLGRVSGGLQRRRRRSGAHGA